MNMLFHHGALGDWVLTFPILRRLAPAMAVTAASKAQLAANLIPCVEPINIEFEAFGLLHRAGGHDQVSSRWRQRFAAAELIVSFVHGPDGQWARNVRRLAPQARLALLDARPPESRPIHVCDWHLQQLHEQGIDLQPPADPPHLEQTGPVLIHPGSGGRDKCWPRQRFEELAVALDQRHPVRLLLGEVELETWPQDTLRHWIRHLNAEPVTDLLRLCELLKSTALFIGNDAGPTHLAAQMGIPTLALFGPTCPDHWAPRGDLVTVLRPARAKPMSWLSVQGVIESANRVLSSADNAEQTL